MSYRKTTLMLLCVVLAIMIGIAAAMHFAGSNEKDPWASLPDKIRQHEAKLTQVAELARAGKDYRGAYDLVRAEWTDLVGPIGVDGNGNVYFVVSTNTFANAGFVSRKGNAPFLGDGFEPRVSETKHLFGQWWFYRCS